MRIRSLTPAFICVLISACATHPAPSAPTGGDIHGRNQGYSLLYKLMSDESDVAKILIIKNADAPLTAVVKDIAAFAQSSKKQLDDFQKSDPELRFDQPDLPATEQESRDLAAKTERHDLLSSSGKNFEIRLAFTQCQAMSYAAQLAKPLANHEPNPARKNFLADLSQHAAQLHARLMDLLTIKS